MHQIRREDYSSDEELLESLIDLYAEGIKKLLFTYVKEWSIAEDLTQETYISCYKMLKDFRGDSSLKTWLYKIAINKCKDYMRTKWFQYRTPFEFLHERTAGEDISVEEKMLGKENDLFLARNVLSLPQIYREVIVLHYYEDLKIGEIEELTGYKQDTIKTRLRRAKNQLRIKMGGDEEWKRN
ncbi:sigma-70 family RNA polymerase sigma factor [Bacillus sp. B-jedd]|uniref:sigma-70 family RNA polymerase sigma factor n=1 Tax=Bacillus sp. B-jedd TaxID=1476857 RepID=UPI0005157262|nr:sigma-70 family RNA polymerase sigma factor [Bacillus sp. B-jedd]CEG27187.1 ECF subfamily RNA polymerase sigma-24 subunit [Bacillus sp. B-jedd]